jgi:hypothetical protein
LGKIACDCRFQYNDKQHSATGYTLFFLNYGRHLWKGSITIIDSVKDVREFTQEIIRAREEASVVIEENREKMKQQQNPKQKTKGLKIGNNVWLENTNLKTNRPTKKLDHWRYSPFKIMEEIGQGAY